MAAKGDQMPGESEFLPFELEKVHQALAFKHSQIGIVHVLESFHEFYFFVDVFLSTSFRSIHIHSNGRQGIDCVSDFEYFISIDLCLLVANDVLEFLFRKHSSVMISQIIQTPIVRSQVCFVIIVVTWPFFKGKLESENLTIVSKQRLHIYSLFEKYNEDFPE